MLTWVFGFQNLIVPHVIFMSTFFTKKKFNACVCADAVCAEAYNPDDDDDDDAEPRVVHPKTDEQRRRLQDACKDILLFKTLEQVHTRVKRHA